MVLNQLTHFFTLSGILLGFQVLLCAKAKADAFVSKQRPCYQHQLNPDLEPSETRLSNPDIVSSEYVDWPFATLRDFSVFAGSLIRYQAFQTSNGFRSKNFAIRSGLSPPAFFD